MGDKTAVASLAAGVSLFGLSLAELGQLATIFAGVMGGLASIAAAVYYVYQIRKGK